METFNNLPKSNCFIYLRRSQDREDRQQLSIDKQDAQVKTIIEQNDFTPLHLLPEERSAKWPGRPIFNEMMQRIENGEARHIAVWALSRLSRNTTDYARVIEAMDRGLLLSIHTPGRSYHNTSSDKFILQIELAVAKKNNDDLSDQVKEGFAEKRKRGQYPGPGPIGYRNEIVSPGNRNIVPHPDKAPLVIMIFKYAATGLYNLDDVWRYADKIGLRSRRGKKLAKQTISEMLKRRAYAGYFKYGGEEVKGDYEALISLDLYEQVQVAMGWIKKSRRAATARGAFFPYKGVLMCETCGFNITAYVKQKSLASGTSAQYTYYGCTKKNKTTLCKEPQVSDKPLTTEIKGKASEFEITETEGSLCIQYLEEMYEDHMKNRNRYIDVWTKDLKEAESALDTLDEKLETGIITDDRYKARASKHQEVVVRTKKLLSNTDNDAKTWLELSKQVFTGATNIGDVFEIADDEEKRQLMLFLGSNWTLGMKKVELTPRRPLDLLHSSNRNLDWRARPDSNRRSPP